MSSRQTFKYNAPANRGGHRGNVMGKALLVDSVMTDAQRHAYEKWRAYQRVYDDAVKAETQAIDEMRKACAMMRRAEFKPARIAELTGYSISKIYGLIQHGESLLGDDK